MPLNIARLAFDALLIGTDRAVALERPFAFFYQQYPVIRMLTQIIGREQAGRTATNDNNIIVVALINIPYFRHGDPLDNLLL